MKNKAQIAKIVNLVIVLVAFIIGVLFFSQKIPMQFAIPISSFLIILSVIVEGFEVHYKESVRSKRFYCLRVGFVIFFIILIIITFNQQKIEPFNARFFN